MGNKMHSSRQDRKTKKRAAENQIPNIPEGTEHGEETVVIEAENLKEQAKKRKRDRNNHATDKDDEAHRKKIKSEKKRAKKVEKENRLRDENKNQTTELSGTVTEAEKQVETNENFDAKQQINMDAESEAEKVIESKNNVETDEKEKKKKKKKKQQQQQQQEEEEEQELMLDEMQIPDINMKMSAKSDLQEEKPLAVDKSLTRKKSKKERKAERRAANAIVTQHDCPEVSKNPEENVYPPKITTDDEKVDLLEESQEILPDPSSSSSSRSSRFIVFVGNLPFTATTASIAAHFAKLKPCAVRNLTQKEDPNKSRGVAFVEFENFDTHKTALKTLHHSIFNDGQSEPRKINVELTAGGGGNKDKRKEKIKIKNNRLNEQRARRTQEEEKAKLLKPPSGVTALSKDSIHPSRRNMISV